MNRQENDLGLRAGFLQLLSSLDAAENRHRDIRDNYVGLQSPGCLHESLTVTDHPNNLKGWFEHAFHEFPNASVVICHKNAHFAHIFCKLVRDGANLAEKLLLEEPCPRSSIEEALHGARIFLVERHWNWQF